MWQKHAVVSALALIGFAGAWLLAASASASLIGDEITVSLVEEGSFAGSVQVTVVDGPEFVGPGFGLDAGESLDVTANSIISVSVGPFGPDSRYTFSDLDWLPDPRRITGFTLTTDIVGLGPEDISFGDDFIVGEAGSDAVTGAGTATVVLITEPINGAPEPATLALLGLALAGLGFARRRKLH